MNSIMQKGRATLVINFGNAGFMQGQSATNFNNVSTSFQLGVFGDDTEATVEEFRQRFNETGALETVQTEFVKQYKEFCADKGINY